MDVIAIRLEEEYITYFPSFCLQIPEKAESLAQMEHSKNVVWLKLQKAGIVGNKRIVRCDLLVEQIL